MTIIAGHTRVLWVPCCHDDQSIKALEEILSEVTTIAKIDRKYRRLGQGDQWVAVFTNPVFADEVRILLDENGYPVQTESVVGTPYPMPPKQEVPAA